MVDYCEISEEMLAALCDEEKSRQLIEQAAEIAVKRWAEAIDAEILQELTRG